MTEHLDFDTSFLDTATQKQAVKQTAPEVPPNGGGSKWNVWVVGALIVAGLMILGALDSSDSTSSNSSVTTQPSSNSANENSLIYNGQTFRCSDYHYDKAMALRPNAVLSAQIDAESSALDTKINNLKLEETRIKNMYVDETDQNSIDIYNSAVDSYNSKKDRLESEINAWNSRNSTFNAQVDAYNNYLDTNCRPQ